MVGAIDAGSRDTVENFKRFCLEAAKVLVLGGQVSPFCQHAEISTTNKYCNIYWYQVLVYTGTYFVRVVFCVLFSFFSILYTKRQNVYSCSCVSSTRNTVLTFPIVFPFSPC